MALVGISLNAATAVGSGETLSFDTPKTTFAAQVETTGSPTFQVGFEGTIDGINFITVGTTVSSNGIQGLTLGGIPLAGIRAKLNSISGGSSPTVTVTISAA